MSEHDPRPRAPEDKRYWLDDSRNVDKIFYGLLVLCVAVVAADLLYHKHGHFDFETGLGFHAAFGFAAYVLLVSSAKLLRKLVKRDEDFYD